MCAHKLMERSFCKKTHSGGLMGNLGVPKILGILKESIFWIKRNMIWRGFVDNVFNASTSNLQRGLKVSRLLFLLLMVRGWIFLLTLCWDYLGLKEDMIVYLL